MKTLKECFHEENIKSNNFNRHSKDFMEVLMRSCDKEVIEPVLGTIIGQIPNWLTGTLLRNGPGNLRFGDMQYKHLFDSSALIQKFQIKEGKITYQCRFVKSEIYKKNRAANKIVMSEFGTKRVPDPCSSIFSRFRSVFQLEMSDNTSVSVFPFGDAYATMTETAILNIIDPETIDTTKRIELKNIGLVSHTAHPLIMKDGTVYNLGMKLTIKGLFYVICCFPNGTNVFKDAKIVAKIQPRYKFHPSYMHSFGITENYFIIIEQPMVLSAFKILKNQIKSDPFISALKWFKNDRTFIYLIDRKTGNLKYKFETDQFFFMHTINQYEKDNHVILDICCFKDGSMLNSLYIESLKDENYENNITKFARARPLRFVMPLIDGNAPSFQKNENLVKLLNSNAEAYQLKIGEIFCVPELICDVGCEAPRFYNEKHLGKYYRYFYGLHIDLNPDVPVGLVKIDLKTKTKLIWCDKHCAPSEPIFVPRPSGVSEDDGIILSALNKYKVQNRSYVSIVVICAKTMTELGRCEFDTLSTIPGSFHGWFIS